MTKRTDLTLDELILLTLQRLRERFYAQADSKFFRDRRALLRAITRFGYECHQRNWAFDQEKIFSEISTLLRKIEQRKADISYLPCYLDAALTLYIRQRADELNEENKRINNVTGRLLGKLTVNERAEQQIQQLKREQVTAALSTLFTVLKPKAGRKESSQLNFFRRLA